MRKLFSIQSNEEMKNRKESKDVLHEFFREGEMHVLNQNSQELEVEQNTTVGRSQNTKIILPESAPVAEEKLKEFWRAL